MKIINYISNIAMPIIIVLILSYSMVQKKDVFDDFVEGAKEGIKIVLNMLPTLVGLFFAIGALRCSGILDFITYVISPILKVVKFPSEILPLAIIRPISGSGSIAIATDIMRKFGVDSNVGVIAATIMGSTETTIYTIAVYTSSVKIKKIRYVLITSLIADFVGIIASVVICRFLS